jgi:hypothetical protein
MRGHWGVVVSVRRYVDCEVGDGDRDKSND